MCIPPVEVIPQGKQGLTRADLRAPCPRAKSAPRDPRLEHSVASAFESDIRLFGPTWTRLDASDHDPPVTAPQAEWPNSIGDD